MATQTRFFAPGAFTPACQFCGGGSGAFLLEYSQEDEEYASCEWCATDPRCVVCGGRILREAEAAEIEQDGESALAHRWCSPTGEAARDRVREDRVREEVWVP